jgi:hypothetical protein
MFRVFVPSCKDVCIEALNQRIGVSPHAIDVGFLFAIRLCFKFAILRLISILLDKLEKLVKLIHFKFRFWLRFRFYFWSDFNCI